MKFEVPFQVDGVHCVTFEGCGVVIDGSKGLVLVDQNTVPMSLGDCTVTIAATVELPAAIIFLHPIHNFAVVRFDPKAVSPPDGQPVPSAKLSSGPGLL